MKENVGRRDQVIRGVAGPALIALGYGLWGGREGRLPGLAAIVAGTAVIESAVTRVCVLNRLLGIDTRTEEEKERDLGDAMRIHGGYLFNQSRMRPTSPPPPPH